jgi:lipopolysaccharide/colanic/teichoic acid biosynthesis glycosyltransferase
VPNEAVKAADLPTPTGLRAPSLLGRLGEIALALFVLALIAPVFLVIAVAIRLDSPGPVLYRCRRVGHGGRVFEMLKFRKMRVDADGPLLTAADDGRFTRLGRVLAALRLDELPQLWNIVRGEMAFVGPRPEDPYFVALNEEPYRKILTVRPGITGLAQLAFASEGRILRQQSGVDYYSERILPQKMSIDRLYASDKSLALDLRILLWTGLAIAGLDIAVNRQTARLTRRRRPLQELRPVVRDEPVGAPQEAA